MRNMSDDDVEEEVLEPFADVDYEDDEPLTSAGDSEMSWGEGSIFNDLQSQQFVTRGSKQPAWRILTG